MTDEVITAEHIDTDDPRVISYLTLRKAIGTVGFALPFVLVIWLEWLAILTFSTSWFTKGIERS